MLRWTLPGAFWLSMAILPILFFYFLRMRFRAQPVSSVYLWARLQKVTTGGSRLRKRSIMLLLLQILAVIAAVVAVAQPFLFFRRTVTPGTVFLIDVSESMNTIESSSGTKTRLEMAKELLTEEIRKLNPAAGCMVFSCDTQANPLLEPTVDHTRVLANLDRIMTRNAGFNEAGVSNQLQAWLGREKRPWQACLISDGGLDLGGQRLANVFDGKLRIMTIGEERGNIGINGLRIINSQALFSIINGWPDEREVQVSLIYQNRTLTRTTLIVPPGFSQQALDLKNETDPGVYKVQLEENRDALASDDVSYLAVNQPRRFRVLLVGAANPFLRSVLSHPAIELDTLPEFSKNLPGYWDLIIADRVQIPPDLKANVLAFEQIPPNAPVSFEGNISGSFEPHSISHPLLRFVKWGEIQVVNGYAIKADPELPVLAEVSGKPVITLWEEEGWRKIVCGFSLYSSNIGLSGTFPIFLQNLLHWLTPQGANPLAYNLTVGEPVVFGEPPEWRIINDKFFETERSGPLIQLKALKTGDFQWKTGSDRGYLTVNIPIAESDLAPRPITLKQSNLTVAAELTTAQIGLTQWPLLILLACLVLEWIIWRGGWRLKRAENGPRSEQDRNLIRLKVLRIITIMTIVLALAGTKVWLPSSHRQMVILIDTSASIPVSRIEEARMTALGLIGQLKPKDRVAVASFAGAPQLIIPFSNRDTVVSDLLGAELDAPKPETTNLQAALLLGKELLNEAQGNRSILIFSDGRSTTGGPLNMVTQRLKGIPINVVPMGRTGGGLFSQGLEVPEKIHPNEPVLGYWKIVTDQARTLPVTVKLNDRTILKKKIAVTPGRNSIPLDLPGQKSGTYRVTVEVDADQEGSFSEANTGAMMQVKGEARVMIAGGGLLPSPVGKALETQGIDVEYGGVEDLPESLLGLTGYGAVVLDNVPALYLTENQQETLQNYVAGGGGLLVIGGDSSLGRGEYYATGLEDLLPVQTDTRQRLLFTRANILFVIDRSGSMSEKVGGVSKQLAAMQGVLGAVKELNPMDEVGILAFDTQPTWVLPFTPVSQEQIIQSSIREIGPGGGTDISTTLEAIVDGFRERGPVRRHTVIITDGLTALDSDYQKLIDRLKTAGITVTTIGIGAEINEELLRNFAKWGEGEFYRAELDQIPKVILKETVRVTRDLIQEGSFRPKVRTQTQVIKGLNQDVLPPVNGYLITKPKKIATVHLETGKADPLLASWRYGSGQVAVFTSDSGGRWLSAWSGTPYYNRLWSQLVRSIERGSTDTGLQVHTGIEYGNALIEVEAISPDRKLRTGLQLIGSSEQSGETFILNETAPGHYQASVAIKGAGLHTFQIREQFGGEPVIGWVWNHQGGESQIFGPDLMFLGQLATVSGGKLFSQAAAVLPKAGWAWKRVLLQNHLIILALLFLIIELGYRSASLGQMRMAQALLDTWWAAQNRLVDMMRGFTFRDSSGDHQKVNEAYRYLAEQARKKKEVGEKDA